MNNLPSNLDELPFLVMGATILFLLALLGSIH